MRTFPPVLVAVLILRASAATSAPSVGPRQPVDLPVEAADGRERWPVVAFTGAGYLAVWGDFRGPSRVYGARLDRNGKAAEPRGFPIGDDIRSEPVVVSGGAVSLVVWQSETAVLAKRVDLAGKVLDAVPILVGQRPVHTNSPVAAWNGSSFLVVWEYDGGIYFRRVGSDGATLDLEPRLLAVGVEPRLATDGRDFLVVWGTWEPTTSGLHDNHLRVGRIAADGRVLDPGGRRLSQLALHQWRHDVCFNGASYLVVFETRDPPVLAVPSGVLHSVLVARDGSPADEVELTGAGPISNPVRAVSCRPEGSVFSWPGTRRGARLDEAGQVKEALKLPEPLTAGDGTDYLMVWTAGPMVASPVLASFQVVEPAGRRVIPATNGQRAPALSRGDRGYLAVWADDRDRGSILDLEAPLFTAALDEAGAPLGPASPLGLPGPRERPPAVAWNGRHHLLVWDVSNSFPETHLRGLRIDSSGKPVEATPIQIATSAPIPRGTSAPGLRHAAPAVASDGSGFLVVWQDLRNTPPPMGPVPPMANADIYAARVSADGAALDPKGIPVAVGTPLIPAIEASIVQHTQPGVAFDGTDYLVVWAAGTELQGQRVDRAGVLKGPPVTIAQEVGWSISNLVAWGGGNYLVVWLGRGGTFARRIAPDGTPRDPAPTRLGPGIAQAVAWDGRDFLVTWVTDGLAGVNVFGTRVGPDGSSPEDGFLIDHSPPGARSLWSSSTALAGDGRGHWLSLVEGYDPAPGIESRRVAARLVTNCQGAACPPAVDGGVQPDALSAPVPQPDGGAWLDAVGSAGPDARAASNGRTASDSGGTVAANGSSGCGCRVGARSSGGAAGAVLVVLALAWLRLRRSHR